MCTVGQNNKLGQFRGPTLILLQKYTPRKVSATGVMSQTLLVLSWSTHLNTSGAFQDLNFQWICALYNTGEVSCSNHLVMIRGSEFDDACGVEKVQVHSDIRNSPLWCPWSWPSVETPSWGSW